MHGSNVRSKATLKLSIPLGAWKYVVILLFFVVLCK